MKTRRGTTRRGGGIVAALLLELVKRAPYATYADLAEDLKHECARLRIAYDATVISSAITQVERGGRRRLVAKGVTAVICLMCGHYSNPDREMEREQQSGACACRCHPWNRLRQDPPPVVPRADATALLARLGVRPRVMR